jgi:hypothetical protein
MSFLPFVKEEHMENLIYPKVDGESVWLTQAVCKKTNVHLYPVKLVFVGVPVSLSAVTSSFILGKEINCGLFKEDKLSCFRQFLKEVNHHYRVTRMPIHGSPYGVSILTCTEHMENSAPSSAVEQLLLRKVKEMRLPCLPEWCGYIRDNLGDNCIRPLSAFNVPEDMFLVQLPTAESFLNDFLMYHLEPLKEIAERGLAA